MEEKELIAKLKELRQIKPSQDWVFLTKDQILNNEEKYSNPFSAVLSVFRIIFAKPAYAATAVVFVFVGLFGTFASAQNSLPGDMLYSVKKISERAQMTFSSQEDLPRIQLELASKRMEELSRIAKENRVKNLAASINETKASISEANKTLAKAASPDEVKKIVDEIEEKAQAVSQTLGVAFGEEELGELRQSSDKLYLSGLLSTLQDSDLTENQEEILIVMQELAEEGEYSEALLLFHTEFNKPAEEDLEDETEPSSEETTEGEEEEEDEVEENENDGEDEGEDEITIF